MWCIYRHSVILIPGWAAHPDLYSLKVPVSPDFHNNQFLLVRSSLCYSSTTALLTELVCLLVIRAYLRVTLTKEIHQSSDSTYFFTDQFLWESPWLNYEISPRLWDSQSSRWTVGFFEVLFGVTAILESGRVGPELEEESTERVKVPRVRTKQSIHFSEDVIYLQISGQ